MTNLIRAMPTLDITEAGYHIKMIRTLPPRAGTEPAEIVLAYLPHNPVTPLATWQRTKGEYGGTFWGHYFKDDEVDEAIADFEARGRPR
jgi:hypothetical protein